MSAGLLASPVYRSVLLPKLTFGMPRNLFMALGTLTLIAVLSLSQYWFALVSLALAGLFNKMSKTDPFFFDLFMGLLKLPDEDLD